MVKKIVIMYLCFHMLSSHAAQEQKAPATPKTPSGVAFSGTVPFRLDTPGLEKVATTLSKLTIDTPALSHIAASVEKATTTLSEKLSEATAAFAKEAAEALKKSELTVKAAPTVTVTIDQQTIEAGKQIAQALSAKATVDLQISDQARENSTDIIGEVGLKTGAVIGLGCFCYHGGSCCMLCPLAAMFVTPYRSIRTAATNSPATLMVLLNSSQSYTREHMPTISCRSIRAAVTNSPATVMALFNRCRSCTRKQQNRHAN